MEKFLVQIVHLLSLFSMFYVDESNAQSLSNLVSTSPTQQATNSTVVVTVTASPPVTLTSRFWQMRWIFDGVVLGSAVFDNTTMITSASGTNTAFSRADINASNPIGPNNQFTSSLILRELQLNESGKVISVEGDRAAGSSTRPPPLYFTLMVKDCPSTISSDLKVEATSYVYNAQGIFKCSNNRELFYSNGTRPSSSATTCLASATWSGQDNWQCWSAPNVTLDGDLTVVEGSNLTFTCDYVDTTPIGSSSIFHVGSNAYALPKNETFTLSSLQRSDNNKVVSCQAVTPYTQLPANNNTGRSQNYAINVQYAAYQEVQTSCNWIINQTESCRVKFASNPPSEFVSLTLNEMLVTNDGPNTILVTNDMQTFYFSRNFVMIADHGRYKLAVRSSVFPNIVYIIFDVNVIERPSSSTSPPTTKPIFYPPGTDQGLIIGVSCAAAAVVILIVILVLIYARKKRNRNEQMNQMELNRQTQSNRVTTTPQYEDVGAVEGESGYLEVNRQDFSLGSLPTTHTGYQNVGIAEDSDGYLTVNGSNSEAPPHNYENIRNASQYPTANSSYMDPK